MASHADYTHYRRSTTSVGPQASEQTLHFEDYLSDEEVRAAIHPIPVIRFERREGHSRVHVIGTYEDSAVLSRRLQDLGRQRYTELEPIWEGEREAKFQEYVESLNLDPYIEMPGAYWDSKLQKKVETVMRIDTRTGKFIRDQNL